MRAPISIRCNPDVDPKTHPYISTGLKNNKFGIAIADVEDIYLRAANMPGIEVKGIDASSTVPKTNLPRRRPCCAPCAA